MIESPNVFESRKKPFCKKISENPFHLKLFGATSTLILNEMYKRKEGFVNFWMHPFFEIRVLHLLKGTMNDTR